MSRKKHDNIWESATLNRRTYIDYFNRLKNLALNVFEWKNLPPTVDERFLELTLFELGYCLYFDEEEIGNLALTCTIGGELDIYRVPTYRRAYATNGYSKPCSNLDSVLIYNNYLRMPTSLTIELFARRLYEIERTIDVNIKGQKTPIAILSSEQQRLTFQNLYMNYDGNQPFIFGDKDLAINDIKAINTNTPYVADKLQIVKHQIFNECLSFLGIENSNEDKKERLVANEVGSNYGIVEAQRYVMLNARRQAVEKINKMFNQNISVDFRSQLQTTVNIENINELKTESEVMENE